MKAIVSLSGGMDSATVLGLVRVQHKFDAVAVFFDYGSKHNEWEKRSAEAVAQYYETPLLTIDLAGAMGSFKSNLLKSGGDIPEGHYEDETMKQTVVPGRNTIFTSIMLGLAQSLDCNYMCLGIHSGDHAIYPDCRPNWFHAMVNVVSAASEGTIFLAAPFLEDNKTSIIKNGLQLKVPYHLTRTCYKNQPISCGKCGSCRERLEAFHANGIYDPVAYEIKQVMG